MMAIRKVAMGVVGFAVVVVLAAPAFAGLLGTGLAYTDDIRTWEGTQSFSKPVTGGTLAGRVDWAVFTASNFSSLFTDYTPTSGKLVYAYQVFNTGAVEISKTMAPLLSGAPADTAGSFTSNGMNGVIPDSTQIIPADVIWNFNINNIWSPGNSAGLAFSSVRKPRTDWYVVVDGGGTVNVMGVAGPGTADIPEPSALTLLAAAVAAWLGMAAYRRRKGKAV